MSKISRALLQNIPGLGGERDKEWWRVSKKDERASSPKHRAREPREITSGGADDQGSGSPGVAQSSWPSNTRLSSI